MLLVCVCGTEFDVKPSYIKRSKNVYCSRACSDSAKRNGSYLNCHACGKSIYRRPSELSHSVTNTYFCTKSCRGNWVEKQMPKGPEHHAWKDGSGSYRERAKKVYGLKCSNTKCPITKLMEIPQQMFDVDHIDGNRSNNDIENLQVLCLWCHGIKTRIDDRE